MILEPVGTVRSCFAEKFAVPRQPGLCPAAWGRLVFHPQYRDAAALRGLEGFSHLWLIFGFHQTADQGWHPTVRPPRLGGNTRVGVFATRSTFRPNPIGLSLVALERIELDSPDGPTLHLGGLDLVDGTPVFDIKPYLPYAEAIPEASSGFASDPIPRIQVIISPEARPGFDAMPPRTRDIVFQALSLDPRPAVQHQPTAPTTHGATIADHNIRFTIESGTCTITAVTSVTPDPC